jgi:hypothetical protein
MCFAAHPLFNSRFVLNWELILLEKQNQPRAYATLAPHASQCGERGAVFDTIKI